MDDAYGFSRLEESLRRFWGSYRQTLLGRGIDFGEVLDRWMQAQKLTFHNPQTIRDFDELCAHGYHPLVLALLVVSMKNAPRLANLWATYVDDSESAELLSLFRLLASWDSDSECHGDPN
jgi:hypothetical protein